MNGPVSRMGPESFPERVGILASDFDPVLSSPMGSNQVAANKMCFVSSAFLNLASS
jgi:hypothetical protein